MHITQTQRPTSTYMHTHVYMHTHMHTYMYTHRLTHLILFPLHFLSPSFLLLLSISSSLYSSFLSFACLFWEITLRYSLLSAPQTCQPEGTLLSLGVQSWAMTPVNRNECAFPSVQPPPPPPHLESSDCSLDVKRADELSPPDVRGPWALSSFLIHFQMPTEQLVAWDLLCFPGPRSYSFPWKSISDSSLCLSMISDFPKQTEFDTGLRGMGSYKRKGDKTRLHWLRT